MIVRDPIFEEHYLKKFNIHTQNSFNQGRSQGVVDILNVIQHFNENEMPVTPKTVMMFLQQMEMKSQEAQADQPAEKVVVETPEEAPAPKQRPKLEVVK